MFEYSLMTVVVAVLRIKFELSISLSSNILRYLIPSLPDHHENYRNLR